MDCTCAIDDVYNDGEYVVFHRAKIVTARKEHKCGECCRVIRRRERYEYVTALQDDFYVAKTCMDCLTARKQFWPHGGFIYTQIWEDIRYELEESGEQTPEDCISKMTPAAQARLCDMIEEVFLYGEDE